MRTNTRNEYEELITTVVTMALERLDRPVSPVELADAVGFSRFHFGRIFSAALGETLAEFTRRLLLERAAWQLRETDHSIGRVATDAGYSVEAFTRAFKAEFSKTPGEFRKSPSRCEITTPNGVHYHPDSCRAKPRILFCKDETMELTKVSLGPLRTFSFPHVGPYHEIGPVFEKLAKWASAHGVPIQDCVGIYYDDPDSTPAAELRADAALLLPDGYEPPIEEDGPALGEIPAQTYVKATHTGSYEGLGDAWAAFMRAIAAEGYVTVGAPFEWYVDDYAVTPVEKLRTDLYMPVRE